MECDGVVGVIAAKRSNNSSGSNTGSRVPSCHACLQLERDAAVASQPQPLLREGRTQDVYGTDAPAPRRSFADTHTLACRSKPSRCACRGPRDVTVGCVARVAEPPHPRPRALAQRHPPLHRGPDDPPPAPGDSSASRSAGPGASSADSSPWRTSSCCTRWRIVTSAAATSASLGPGAG